MYRKLTVEIIKRRRRPPPIKWMMVLRTHESTWAKVKLAALDELTIGGVDFSKNKSKKKVNLMGSIYLDDNGNYYSLPSVQKAEKLIHSMNLNKEYSPILGDSKFCTICEKFVLGEESPYTKNALAVSVQTLACCAGLRIGFTVIKRFYTGKKIVFISNPSWSQHEQIIKRAGLDIGTYKYYDPTTKDLDFNGLMDDIKRMPDQSVILFTAAAHLPTGIDPSHNQWNQISARIKSKKMLTFFDMPYQGLASGDPDEDAYSIRKFVSDGNRVMFAVSFSRNMGLYGERTGALTILVGGKEEANKLTSQLKMIVRGLYSNPPINGARIVVKILEDPGLRADWRSECREMADRMITVRKAFKQAMVQLGSSVNWDHFDKSVGMTSICGLLLNQVTKLRDEHSVYLLGNGRINIGSVHSKNIDYVTECFHEVTK